MLFERPAEERYIVGFDLRDDFCQVSFLDYLQRPLAGDPTTFSTETGKEQFNIPTVLYKTNGVNKWYCGQEAARNSANEGGTFLPSLLSKALAGAPVAIEGNEYDPLSLLALFVNRTLTVLGQVVPNREIAAIMFTAREMDERTIQVLENVRERLDLKCKVFYESYAASFYNYMLMRPQELRDPAVMMAECEEGEQVRISKLKFNQRTRPIVAFRTQEVYPAFQSGEPAGRDAEFVQILQKELDRTPYSSVFLIGSGFQGNWMRRSVAILCKGRRVFMGNNLYSRGAVYGALFKLAPPRETESFFFLDGNKLRSNVGIRAMQGGRIDYHAILDAGVNWYEVKKDADLILEDTNEIHLVMTPLTGGEPQDFLIRLDKLPVREDRTTRVRMHFSMTSPDKIQVMIEDMGFGDIFPSTGLKWAQTITVNA